MDEINGNLSNKENELSEISKPYEFLDYFDMMKTSQDLLHNFKPKKSYDILNSSYRVCPRTSSRHKNIMTSSAALKVSTCFICDNEFPSVELPAHEKACLQNIQTTDVDYTRQNTNESESSLPHHILDSSNISNHSASSSDSYEKKFVRCYICGTDVPTYLTSIHEKNCKKNWETGLFNSICGSTAPKKSSSRGNLTLSRGTSRTDLRREPPNGGLKKSKSSSNIVSPATDKVFFDDEVTSPKPKGMTSLKSKSHTNLNKTKPKEKKPFITGVRNTDWSRTKSLQDVRSEKTTPKKSAPSQYVLCNICGKLYSMHSIGIHERQCERTRSLQKNAGSVEDYKIKSKSLADLSITKKSASLPRPSSRPATASNSRKHETKLKLKERPSTAQPMNQISHKSRLSASMGNLTQAKNKHCIKQTEVFSDGKNEAEEVVKEKINKTACENKIMNNADNADGKIVERKLDDKKVGLSPGLQKCYLCGQLYGTRSLPIHEKQCLKKWERDRKEERVKEASSKKPKKEIKVVPFGRSKISETLTSPSSLSPDKEKVVFSPGKLDGVESSLKSPPTEAAAEMAEETAGNVNKSDVQSERSYTNTASNGNILREDKTNQNGISPNKFVPCLSCRRNYGQHSIHIHEKSCRDRKQILEEAQDQLEQRLRVNKKISAIKDLGGIPSENLPHLNGDVANGDDVDMIK